MYCLSICSRPVFFIFPLTPIKRYTRDSNHFEFSSGVRFVAVWWWRWLVPSYSYSSFQHKILTQSVLFHLVCFSYSSYSRIFVSSLLSIPSTSFAVTQSLFRFFLLLLLLCESIRMWVYLCVCLLEKYSWLNGI